MSRLSIPTVENAPEASKPLFAAVNKQLGVVPNLMKLVGHSPAALEGYLSLNGALAKGKLNVKLRESIALAVAEYNGCDYCLSAHDYLGRNVATSMRPATDTPPTLGRTRLCALPAALPSPEVVSPTPRSPRCAMPASTKPA
jgi:AhpD family alkylhydroperoxidase